MEYHYPTCLTIAGSDSSGGAGIQADLKTMSALGTYGMSVVTAITAQNTCGVTDIQAISPHIVKAQLEAVFSDIACDAVKIGMLFSSENIEVILDILDKYSPRFIVLDPVLVSTSGHKLYAEENIGVAMKERLFPKATIITPNTEEASLLSGIPISNEHDMYRAGEVLMKTGCRAVLVKGGVEQILERLFVRDVLNALQALLILDAVGLHFGHRAVARGALLCAQHLLGILERCLDHRDQIHGIGLAIGVEQFQCGKQERREWLIEREVLG